MKEYFPVKEGKVREIYDVGENMILVATDRISCFDVILNNIVTKKGTVLTQMSKFWFDFTKDIVKNHMISVDTKDMPEFFRQEKFEGNSMLVKKLTMLPVECIVRGYITGSGWKSYQENGTVCGIKLPEGLLESEKLPRRPRSVTTTRTSRSSSPSLILRSASPATEKSTPPSFAITQSRFIRSARITLLRRASSLPIRSLSSVLMRTARSLSATKC